MVEDHKGIKQIGITYDSGWRVIDWMRERERELTNLLIYTKDVFMRVSCP